MSITSILAGYSAINILTTPGNINIPSGAVDSDFNICGYVYHNDRDFYANIPFNYTNAGYFALTDLSIDITLRIVYINKITQESESIILFTGGVSLPDLNKGETYSGIFVVESDDITYTNIPKDLFYTISQDRDPLISVYADASLGGTYGIGLYVFDATIQNIEIASTNMDQLPQNIQNLIQASQVI